ncbi:hypothetical protein JCM11251_000954 [Rhodosporidiobolus azoricus]
MAALPPAFHGWFRSNYPTVVFAPDWLAGCVEYLQSTDPTTSTTQGLIKAVETQLLSSDLSTSVVPPASNRAAFSTIYSARDKALLFNGGPRKAGVLVQIQSVEDVKHSALEIKEVLEEKREARRVAEKGGVAGGERGGRIMRLDDEEGGEGATEEEEEEKEKEEDEVKKKVLKGDRGPPKFPRGSGKFVLSDGVNEVRAFELQPLLGLSLEEIKLGTKLLIYDVPSVNGILMLSPKNTTVKGYQVEEYGLDAEWRLENSLRARLKMDLLPHPADVGDPGIGNAVYIDNGEDAKKRNVRAASPLQRALANAPPLLQPAASSSHTAVKQPSSPSASFDAQPHTGPIPRARPPSQPSSEQYYGDDVDFDLGDDEEAEKAWAEAEAQAVASQQLRADHVVSSGAARVKKPPSSGSGASGGTSSAGGNNGTGAGGIVGLIDLLDDSDDEPEAGEEDDVKPVRKKVKQERAARGTRLSKPVGAKKGTVTLEIDSD